MYRKDTQTTLTGAFGLFLFPGVFLKAATQKYFEKQFYLNVQEFLRKDIAQFFQSKTVLHSFYCKNLRLYEKIFPQISYS